MAKKQFSQELTDEFRKTLALTNIINVEVQQELKKSFIDYAMCVNRSRAIPDVRDGLKPVHRRILYSMNELSLTPDKAYKKCAAIVGDVLGKYHPHGDSSVYDALVRMAQDFSINLPLVDGHGNFGSVDGDPPAAYRYTEARMSKMSLEMLREIDKETVDFYPNFDDTRMQPVVLPSRYPNLLVNGSDGIAVGMATNIPPHNLAETINACIALIDNEDITIDELIEHIPAPDFPTGGIIMGRSGIKNAYRTGRGNIIVRAKCEIEEYSNGTRNRIIVTELPYQVNKQRLIETIADLVKNKKLEGISNVNDETDREGMRIVIDLKKDANCQVVLNSLYKQTNLQISNGIILLALVGTDPKVLNIKEILSHYVAHQISVIERRTRYDLARLEERAHIVSGLVIALASIDEVIEIIKRSKDKADANKQLTENFELDDKQANAILEMRLQRLTSMEVQKLQDELESLKASMEDLRDILANPYRVKEIIKTDLNDIKIKYPSPRLSEISVNYSDIGDADLIEREDIVISMTHLGYIKRLPVSEYKAQKRGGKGITAHKPKDEDFVENMFISSTHDNLMFFTNFGKVYTIKGYEVPEAQRTARGRAIVNLLSLDEGERVTAIIPLKEDTTTGYVIMATKFGLIKKTDLKEFAKIRKGGKVAITLVEDDSLISVQFTDGEKEILLGSADGKCIRFSESNVRCTGRDSQGVKSIELDKDDFVVDMVIVDDSKKVLTITANGYGKRCETTEYTVQFRGGKGVKAGTFSEKTGKLASLKMVSDDEDIMAIADSGIVIRIKATDLPIIQRPTQGVIAMRLNEGKIVTVAITPKEDDETTEDENIDTENDVAEITANENIEAETEVNKDETVETEE